MVDGGVAIELMRNKCRIIGPDNELLPASEFAVRLRVARFAFSVMARIESAAGLYAYVVRQNEPAACFVFAETALNKTDWNLGRTVEAHGQRIGMQPSALRVDDRLVNTHEGVLPDVRVGFHDHTGIASVRNVGSDTLRLVIGDERRRTKR